MHDKQIIVMGYCIGSDSIYITVQTGINMVSSLLYFMCVSQYK